MVLEIHGRVPACCRQPFQGLEQGNGEFIRGFMPLNLTHLEDEVTLSRRRTHVGRRSWLKDTIRQIGPAVL